MRPKLLDGFCKAGGAGMGYYRAGFDVVGVDIEPQKNYPFEFIQADWFEFMAEHGQEYDAHHISPPCQAYSEMQRMHKNKDKHPDYIARARDVLKDSRKPYVIENVEGAPLMTHVMLCGTMFGLGIAHHRLFECSFDMPFLNPPCNHKGIYDRFHGGEQARGERLKMSNAMGIDWFMTRPEVRNAIPPAYTEYIGKHLLAHLQCDPRSGAEKVSE